jgi:myo-inositol-1(or 4)-monophosphatase
MSSGFGDFITRLLASVLQATDDLKLGFVRSKTGDPNQVVTKADLAIGSFLVEEILRCFPSHNIVDEEAGCKDHGSDFTWVIDPIDGTSNFAVGVPLYGVMVGVLRDAVPVAGGIALPGFQEICVAEKGGGAWSNGQRLRVSEATHLLDTLIAYGIDSHQEDPSVTRDECALLAELVLSVRNIRSSNSCFDAVMVAKGRYGLFLNRTGKIWDHVAQHVLIEEAGGLYTGFFGAPMDYSDPTERVGRNYTVCAGAAELHKQIQRVIHGFGGTAR